MAARHARAWVPEWRAFWGVVLALSAIAVVVSIRRLFILADASLSDGSDPAAPVALDALFAARAGLTRAHVMAGLVLALLIPVQLSARVRARVPRVHRWLGRLSMMLGLAVGVTGYALAALPIGGWIEAAAIVVYATAFLAALAISWFHIRRGAVADHREWMLRAVAIVLGIAATRPVVGMFFATSTLTGLSPSEFFGVAFWIGFTSTALAGEAYVWMTRPGARTRSGVRVSSTTAGAEIPPAPLQP